MLQRGTMPTVSNTTAELSESWQESIRGEWSTTAQAAAHLPKTPREFMIYCVGLLLIACGLGLHVFLSVQILDARVQIQQINAEIERIERVNSEIVYATTLHTSVDRMVRRAKANGYVYTTERKYVDRRTLFGPTAAEAFTPASATASERPDIRLAENRLRDLPQRMGEFVPALPDRSTLNDGIMAAGDQIREWSQRGEASWTSQQEQLRQRLEGFSQRE